MAQTYGFALIPWSPIAGGLLSGKYRRGEQPPEDSRYAGVARNPMQQRRWVEGIFDVVEALEPIANEKGQTLAELAVAWVAQQPGVRLDKASIEKLNASITGYIHDDETRKQILGENKIADNASAPKDAINLNNLDDWHAFHQAVLK